MNKVWGHRVSQRSVCGISSISPPPDGHSQTSPLCGWWSWLSPYVGSSLQRKALLFRLIMYPLMVTRPAQTARLMFINVRWKRTCERLEVGSQSVLSPKTHFSTLHVFVCNLLKLFQPPPPLPHGCCVYCHFDFFGLIIELFDRQKEPIVASSQLTTILALFCVCRLHGKLDLMHGSCMTAVGLEGPRAQRCSHGSNHACEWQRPR